MAWGRLKQHRVIADRILRIHDKKTPIILAGDFNDWDRKAAETLGECGLHEAFQVKYGKSARTYPDFLPMLSLDRVYFKNLRLIDAKRLDESKWRRLSDHSALYCEFEVG
jgi:endonuclease/exonuclease/phosphatase family metal-dependent hydrolase